MFLLVEIDLAGSNAEMFEAYEAAVLALLKDHGGRLERRLRSEDGRREVHLLFFPDGDTFEAYLADDRREAARAAYGDHGARVTAMTRLVEIDAKEDQR